MRRLASCHVLGDLAAQADDLDRLVGARRRRRGPRRCRRCRAGRRRDRRGGRGRCAVFTWRKVDAEIARAGADGGRGEDVSAGARLVRARRLRGSTRRRGELAAGCGAGCRSLGRARPGSAFACSGVASTAPSASGRSSLGCRRPARRRGPRLRSRSPPAPSRSGSGRRLRRPARAPCRRPGYSISTVALSVIMSASCWSSSIVSPTLTCQATISASAMPSPMSGSLNSIACHQSSITFFERLLHALRAREIGPFVGVRVGRVPAGDALDRRFEMIEAALLHQRRPARRRSRDVRVASWTTTQRPVFFTDCSIVSMSSGTRVRRSITSASMPCSSTAASATWTIVP